MKREQIEVPLELKSSAAAKEYQHRASEFFLGVRAKDPLRPHITAVLATAGYRNVHRVGYCLNALSANVPVTPELELLSLGAAMPAVIRFASDAIETALSELKPPTPCYFDHSSKSTEIVAAVPFVVFEQGTVRLPVIQFLNTPFARFVANPDCPQLGISITGEVQVQGEQVTELHIATFDVVSKLPAFSEVLLHFYA